MSLPILMQPPGRSTFTQSGLIELGKPVQTLPDGSFKEVKVPKEPRKKNAEPELPQPAVGPRPTLSGAPRRRGDDDEVLKVFSPLEDKGLSNLETVPSGQAVSGIEKSRKLVFAKGSQEAKDYMAKIRGLRKPKASETIVSASETPVPVDRKEAAKKAAATRKANKLAKQDAAAEAALAAMRADPEKRKQSLAAIKAKQEAEDAAALAALRAAAKPKKTRKAKSAAAAAAATDEEDADLILANELLESVKPKKAKKAKKTKSDAVDAAELARLQSQLADMNRRIADATRR